jgi:hypothetical protein
MIFVSTGSGILQWTDCSYSFSRSLEDQYQQGRRHNNHIQRRWDSWSQTYVEKMFLHDLAAMTQFNYQTKVQKPLRRCLISDPVEEEDHPKFRTPRQLPSTGTAEPASTSPAPVSPIREAADVVQPTPQRPLEILADLVPGTAEPALAAADAAQPALAAADAVLPHEVVALRAPLAALAAAP